MDAGDVVRVLEQPDFDLSCSRVDKMAFAPSICMVGFEGPTAVEESSRTSLLPVDLQHLCESRSVKHLGFNTWFRAMVLHRDYELPFFYGGKEVG